MRLFKLRKHATARAYVHDWLEPDDVEQFNWMTAAIVLLVVASLISLAIETEAVRPDTPMPAWVAADIRVFNQIVVYIFAGEFLLRFWAVAEDPRYRGVGGRMRFLASPLAVTDMLAFLPELLIMLFVPQEEGAWLAAARALRLFRLLKLARYVPAFSIVGNALKRAGAPLIAALCVAAAQVYLAALMLYFIEGQTKPEAFGSVTRALWWSMVTLTTVGYGDVYPESVMGRVAAGLVAVAGVGIVAMPTGILASAFAEEFRLRQEKRELKAREAAARRAAESSAD